MDQQLALSVAQFCAAHDLSRALFYQLVKDGKGPTLMHVGRRTLISHEAAAAWRRRMEQTPAAEIA